MKLKINIILKMREMLRIILGVEEAYSNFWQVNAPHNIKI